MDLKEKIIAAHRNRWIEAAKTAGKPVPAPNFRTAIYQAAKIPA